MKMSSQASYHLKRYSNALAGPGVLIFPEDEDYVERLHGMDNIIGQAGGGVASCHYQVTTGASGLAHF